MNDSNEQDRLVSVELEAHCQAAPSPGLRDRVLRTARTAWEEDVRLLEEDVPWTGSVLRLAASFAIAILLIASAKPANRFFFAVENRPGRVDVAEAPNRDPNAVERFIEYQRRLQELLSADLLRNG